MGYLSRNLNGLKQDKKFKYHPRCARLGITYLSFADDLLLFARGYESSVTTLQSCFKQFSSASRLQANMSKSYVYFGGVPQPIRDKIVSKLHFVYGELPFKYGDIPL